jgi:hypothetical protein
MFCLPKPDTSVWQTGTSGFARKTKTSDLKHQTIQFFQTEHINKTTFTIGFQAFINTHLGMNDIAMNINS